MASSDKVKKGFGFYLFMLLLVIVAAFLVIVMVMLFSPGKAILGYKYFSYSAVDNKAIVETTTTSATPQTLDFDSIDRVIISTDYARVKISKTIQTGTKDCIIITNTAKGFAQDKKEINTELSYSITLSEEMIENVNQTVLTISVTEPQGFLFFSKNIEINLRVGAGSQANLSNAAFVITTNSGKVSLDEDYAGLAVKDLTVTTTSGNIALAENREYRKEEIIGDGIVKVQTFMTFNSLYLSTASGSVNTTCNFVVNNMAKFTVTGNGSFNLQDVEDLKGVQLALEGGSFKANDIIGDVKVLNLNSGNITINRVGLDGLVGGTFETIKANGIGKAKVDIKNIERDIAIPYGGEATYTIGKVSGQTLIKTTSGNIKVEELIGPSIIESVSGSIDVTINDQTYASLYPSKKEHGDLARSIESQTGKIKLTYSKSVESISNIKTKGDIEIVLPQNTKFLLDLKDYEGNVIQKLSSTVTINFIENEDYTPPYKVNYQGEVDNAKYVTNRMNVFGGGRINVHM